MNAFPVETHAPVTRSVIEPLIEALVPFAELRDVTAVRIYPREVEVDLLYRGEDGRPCVGEDGAVIHTIRRPIEWSEQTGDPP